MTKPAGDIFNHTDYRAFLKKVFDKQNLSQGKLVNILRSKYAIKISRSNISDMLRGKRNLNEKHITPIGKAIHLNDREIEYFTNMVRHENEKSERLKEYHLNKMIQIAGKVVETREIKHYKYFSNWYNLVLRELAVMGNWKGDCKKLSTRFLFGNVTEHDIKESVYLMQDLGIIKKLPGGRFKQENPIIRPSREVSISASKQCQRNFLEQSVQSLYETPKEEREIRTMTCSLSQEGLMKIKDEIEACMDKIKQVIAEDREQDRVFNINFSCFPVTKRVK